MVNYSKIVLIAFKGNNTNCFYGINNPITADNNGILNVLLAIGNFCNTIFPFIIWACGTVGDINGYLTPFAKFGDIRVEYPILEHKFGTGVGFCDNFPFISRNDI